MLPVGPLMIEHRLIERMIALMAEEAGRIEARQTPDAEFIRTAVEFVRTYADALHHGKEENILFRDLAKKPLNSELSRIMSELVQEHALGRAHVHRLVEARRRFLHGDPKAAAELSETMRALAGFYPEHIAKEDNRFFLPVMAYFTAGEQAAMLEEFHEFDRGFVHAHYRGVVSALDGKRTSSAGNA